MEDNPYTRSFAENSEILGIALKVMLVVAFAMNILFSGGAIYMLYLIRTLQMILHIPMFKIVIPANLMQIISNTLEVAMFDILPAERTTDFLFKYNEN